MIKKINMEACMASEWGDLLAHSKIIVYIKYNSKATNVYQYPPLYMLLSVSCHVDGDNVEVHIEHNMIVGTICERIRFLTLYRAFDDVIVDLSDT